MTLGGLLLRLLTLAPGISGSGRDAEDLFVRLTGATRAARAAQGDAVLEGHLVEVKWAGGDTLNQVRAVKFITLVVHDAAGMWYVVPPQDVVRLVASKSRGQHTENPFESATVSLRGLGPYAVSDPSQLRALTLAAAHSAQDHAALKAEMDRVLAASRELAGESVRRVMAILGDP